MHTYDIEAHGVRGDSVDLVDTYTGTRDEAEARFDDAVLQGTAEAEEAGLSWELILKEDGRHVASVVINGKWS